MEKVVATEVVKVAAMAVEAMAAEVRAHQKQPTLQPVQR